MGADFEVDRGANGVAVLTLARPDRRNALSVALRDAVADELHTLRAAEDLRVLIVTGAGDTFCSGFDLTEFERVGERSVSHQVWASSDRFHRAWLEFPLPTIAAVNGPALAGGFDLALMCDLRMAADTASFGHPEATFGTVAYGLLREMVDGSLARELALTGRTVCADEALARGLVTQVAPQSELGQAARALASTIAPRPRHVLVADKQKIIRRSGHHISGTLDL